MSTISERLLAVMKDDGAREALVDRRGRVSRREFTSGVGAAVSDLRQKTRGPRTLVAVFCDEGREFVFWLCAANHLGMVVLPVYKDYPSAFVQTLVTSYQPAVFIAPEAQREAWSIRTELWCPFEIQKAPRCHEIDVAISTGGPALVLLTSGSTGRPKGVVLGNDGILSCMDGVDSYMHLTAQDHCLISRSLTHASALVAELLVTLATGGTAVLTPRPATARQLCEWIDRECITWLSMPPIMLRVLVEYAGITGRQPTCRRIVTCGAPLPPSLASECHRAMPATALINAYGLTEASPRVSYLSPEMALTKAGAAGIPIPGCEIRIASDNGRKCDPNEVGMIEVRGRTLMLGYFPDGMHGAQPYADRWLCTGDLGYIDDDGVLVVVGRRDTMIVHHGMNIYPETISGVICGCEGVRHAQYGQTNRGTAAEQLVAFVEFDEGVDQMDAVVRLRHYLQEHLDPRHHPEVIVPVGTMLRLPSGKPDWLGLCRLHAFSN